jgi:uncharacterized protein with HEPN domain
VRPADRTRLRRQDAGDRSRDPSGSTRWIEVLGEAATHLSEELRSAHPEIPWREIIGTRVILAHAYFHVDQDIIGDVVKRDVPAVRSGLQAIVDSLDPD